jgi:hypothetical protein
MSVISAKGIRVTSIEHRAQSSSSTARPAGEPCGWRCRLAVGVLPLAWAGRVGVVLVLALTGLLFGAAPVFAKETHVLLSTFNGSQALDGAESIAVDDAAGGEGDIYVANSGHNTIDRFSATGQFVSAFGVATQLAVDQSSGDVYATLFRSGVLEKYTGSGTRIAGFGGEGQVASASIPVEVAGVKQLGAPGVGRPFAPYAVAVDPVTSEVFVSDKHNGVIDVFDSAGDYLRQFAAEGILSLAVDSGGQLFGVTGSGAVDVYEAATGLSDMMYGGGTGEVEGGGVSVAVDSSTNDLYVVRGGSGQRVIGVFDSAGVLLDSFTNGGMSRGLAVGGAEGDVYVLTEPAGGGSEYVSVFGGRLVPAAEPESGSASEVMLESAVLNGVVNPNGLPVSECYFEYGPSEGYGQKASCEDPSAGEIPAAEGEYGVHAKIAVEPGMTYHFRLVSSDANGAVQGLDESFATPKVPAVEARSEAASEVKAESAVLNGVIDPNGLRVSECYFEYGSSDAYGKKAGCEDPAAGEIPEAAGEYRVHAKIAMTQDTTYYFRLVGAGVKGVVQGSGETIGVPVVEADAVHMINGEGKLSVVGVVNAPSYTDEQQDVEVGVGNEIYGGEKPPATGGSFTLTFAGQTTAPIAFEASASAVQGALEALSGIGAGNIEVGRENGGNGEGGKSYVVKFVGADVGDTEPLLEVDGSGLTPAGASGNVRELARGSGGKTRYHFEFVTEKQFEEGDWSSALSAPLQMVSGADYVTEAVPAGLQPGGVYRFRVGAESEAYPGVVEHSPVKRLVVPAPVAAGPQSVCPNEAERTGQSARLPDCRAYEQVTPAEKGGAQDIYNYSSLETQTAVGLDGEHFVMGTLSKWGSNVQGDKTLYLFSRGSSGWGMTSFTPQPQTGGYEDGVYEAFTPDLSRILIERDWFTSGNAFSPTVEYVLGPAGGPYTAVASEPTTKNHELIMGSGVIGGGGEHDGHWVGQSRNGAVAVLTSPDHELIPGHKTGTVSHKEGERDFFEAFDLYEYSNKRLSQLNVYSDGQTIGACGAAVVQGREDGERGKGSFDERNNGGEEKSGGLNAISADGSRIFFYASPGSCPSEEEVGGALVNGGGAAKIDLFMRMDGAQTVEIGNYTFEGANPEGTRLFLSKAGSGGLEFFSYDTETQTVKHLFSVGRDALSEQGISENGDDFYFSTDEILTPEAVSEGTGESGEAYANIYRYDIPAETLTYVASYETSVGDQGDEFFVSPNGEQYYFQQMNGRGMTERRSHDSNDDVQVYRYDAGEDVVQCISCASSYDPEPRLNSLFMQLGGQSNLAPLSMVASENGDFVFFDALSELVPQDVNGEIEPGYVTGEDKGLTFSPSSDVYEWRRNGVDGCGLAQGCLALISNGIDGEENVLLGTDPSGRDVFFATHSQLVPQDKDKEGDVYDARIDGGFPPPPPRPTECEGDACSTPSAPPSDATPASVTFQGAGNVSESSTGGAKAGKTGGRKAGKKRRHGAGRKKRGAVKVTGRPRRTRARGGSSRSAGGRRVGERGGR